MSRRALGANTLLSFRQINQASLNFTRIGWFFLTCIFSLRGRRKKGRRGGKKHPPFFPFSLSQAMHMYDEFHVPDVLIVLLYMWRLWRLNSHGYWFKQKQSYKLSMSDFPKLYPATLSISMLCIIFARFACCCCLSQKFWKDSITTTLPLLIACFHATILIVLSFTHGATIKAKLWLEESQTWREHLPENGSWILIG